MIDEHEQMALALKEIGRKRRRIAFPVKDMRGKCFFPHNLFENEICTNTFVCPAEKCQCCSDEENVMLTHLLTKKENETN